MKTSLSPFLRGPHTRLGRWSIGLIIAMPFLFLIGITSMNLFYSSVPAGNSILEDLAGRPALALPMLAGMTAGIMAFVTGLVAIVREQERALFVYLSTAIGALLLLFLLGEFISPH
jgi:hypothetical protein